MSLFIQYNLWFFADNLLSHRQTFVDAFQILKTSNILGHSPRQNSVHRSDYCFGLTLLLPIGYSRRYRFTVEVEVSPFSVEIFHFIGSIRYWLQNVFHRVTISNEILWWATSIVISTALLLLSRLSGYRSFYLLKWRGYFSLFLVHRWNVTERARSNEI